MRHRTRIALCALSLTLSLPAWADPLGGVDGWGSFKFGMTPEEAEKASTIPLTKVREGIFREGIEPFTGNTTIGNINYIVNFQFIDVLSHPTGSDLHHVPHDWRLNLIVLSGIPPGSTRPGEFQPCPLKSVATMLVSKYGRPNGHETTRGGAHMVVWSQSNGDKVLIWDNLAQGRTREKDSCLIDVEFADPKIVAQRPVDPKFAPGQF